MESVIMSKTNISRRNVLRVGVATGVGFSMTTAYATETMKSVTPPQTSGPFYPIVAQSDKDADLTLFGNSTTLALGEIITVEGKVLGDDGKPIADAVVDIWQANAAGRYAHETDPNPAPLDANFQGWAILKTDADGRYRFKTVRPGAYPAAKGWDRPPHIHFKVSRRGYHEITTQMYFENEPLNDVDRLLNALTNKEQSTLIAKRDGSSGSFSFDIVLAVV